jgi:hypothetical protein
MSLHLVNALRGRIAEFAAMTRLCAFPLIALTIINCVLLLTSQGQELLLSAWEGETSAKVVLTLAAFGATCAAIVATLLTQPVAYTFEDRSASGTEWARLLRSVYPSLAFSLAAMPAAIWLFVLLQDARAANENSVWLAACSALGIFLSCYFFRRNSRRLLVGAAFSLSLLLPLLVLSVAGTDNLEQHYLPLLHNFSAAQVLTLVYGYWVAVLAVLAIIQRALSRLGKWHDDIALPRRVSISLVACLIVTAAFAFAALAVHHEPIGVARDSGPLTMLLLGMAAWVVPTSLLFVYLPRRVGLPSLALAIPIVIYFLSGSTETHQIRTGASQDNTTAAQELPTYLMGWLRSRDVRPNERFPVIIVAAEGGGIRATYWTAAVLSRLDDTTNGRFPHHLFGISSVSGGSFGAALYAAALADRRDNKEPVTPTVAALTSKVASNDFLSPLVSGLLFNDAVQAVIPGSKFAGDRAAWFEQSWEQSWKAVAGSDRFAAPLQDLYNVAGQVDISYAVPALFVNATEVNTGRKFLFSNIRVAHGDFPATFLAQGHPTLQGLSGAPLSAVAHASARFPFLSPAATLSGSPTGTLTQLMAAARSPHVPDTDARVPWGNVVDGGYLDNSGAGTAADLLRALKFYEPQVMRALALTDERFKGASLDFYVLLISNDPLSASGRQHVYRGGGSDDWFASYQTAATSPELEARGRRGLPDRPLEASPEALDRLFLGALNTGVPLDHKELLYPPSRLSEFTSPPVAVLNARTARADAAKSSLAALANEPPEGFFRSECCSPQVIALSGISGEMNPCRLAPRAFEASLGRALDQAVPVRDSPSYGDSPPLGWYLRESSRRTLERALAHLGDQGVDSLASQVVDPYSKGLGNPRLACEVSLVTRGFYKDAGVQKYLEVHSPVQTPTKVEPIPETPCAQVQGQAELRNALFHAIQNGSTAQAECLVNRGANVNARDIFRNSPLILALQKKNERLARLLLQRGADVNLVGENGNTALLEAVEEASASMVVALLDKGANFDAHSITGYTPLMAAASQCRLAIAKELVRRGADLTVRDDRGYAALEWSKAMKPCPGWAAAVASK